MRLLLTLRYAVVEGVYKVLKDIKSYKTYESQLFKTFHPPIAFRCCSVLWREIIAEGFLRQKKERSPQFTNRK